MSGSWGLLSRNKCSQLPTSLADKLQGSAAPLCLTTAGHHQVPLTLPCVLALAHAPPCSPGEA